MITGAIPLQPAALIEVATSAETFGWANGPLIVIGGLTLVLAAAAGPGVSASAT